MKIVLTNDEVTTLLLQHAESVAGSVESFNTVVYNPHDNEAYATIYWKGPEDGTGTRDS